MASLSQATAALSDEGMPASLEQFRYAVLRQRSRSNGSVNNRRQTAPICDLSQVSLLRDDSLPAP